MVPPILDIPTLVVTSPGVWTKGNSIVTKQFVEYVMPVPSCAEILDLWLLAFPELDRETLELRREFWGHIPRRIFSRDVEADQQALRNGVKVDWNRIVGTTRGADYGHTSSDDAPHRFVLVRSVGDEGRDVTGTTLDMDETYFTASPITYFTSRPWEDLARKLCLLDSKMFRGEVGAAMSASDLQASARGVQFEVAAAKALVCVAAASSGILCKIRDLHNGSEGHVRVWGGQLAGWGTAADLEGAVKCGSKVPLRATKFHQPAVDIVCWVSDWPESWGGLASGYVAMNFTVGGSHSINMPGLQSVATALGWYDKFDYVALRADANATFKAAVTEAGESGDSKGAPKLQLKVVKALAEKLLVDERHGTVPRPRKAAPLPFIFVLQKAQYDSDDWKKPQRLVGAAVGRLSECVHQYAIELCTEPISTLDDVNVFFSQAADSWTIDSRGVPVRPAPARGGGLSRAAEAERAVEAAAATGARAKAALGEASRYVEIGDAAGAGAAAAAAAAARAAAIAAAAARGRRGVAASH